MLILEPGRVMLDAGNRRMAEQLDRRKIEPIVGTFGDRLRAAHLALWRESGPE
jgi:hypothetical protein